MRTPMIKNLPHLTPGMVIAVAGVALLVAGSALGLAFTANHSSTATTTPTSAQAQAALAIDGQATGSAPAAPNAAAPDGPYIEGVTPSTAVAAPDATRRVPGTTSASEPFWRTKQREAEAEQEAAQLIAGLDGTKTVPAPAPAAPASTPPVTSAGVHTVGGGGTTKLQGIWGGTADTLARYLTASNASPRFTVSTQALAQLYITYAAQAGLRADVLWGQMIHETGWGSYGGDVGSLQNNFAGIGATGGGARGYAFPTAEDGVKAHVAHMVAYVYLVSPVGWANELVDPRYNAVSPRGVARVVSDLDGRWAVPGVGYGATIDAHVAALNR
jgi:Mannosyl-glycoprotein endo-beta-N-acetylglucosaminidase